MFAPDLINAHLMDVALGARKDKLYNNSQMLRSKVDTGVLKFAVHSGSGESWAEYDRPHSLCEKH